MSHVLNGEQKGGRCQKSLVFLAPQGVQSAIQMRKTYDLANLAVLATAVMLTAGTAMQLWISDNIELHGLGDGLNFLICLSIVAGAPQR